MSPSASRSSSSSNSSKKSTIVEQHVEEEAPPTPISEVIPQPVSKSSSSSSSSSAKSPLMAPSEIPAADDAPPTPATPAAAPEPVKVEEEELPPPPVAEPEPQPSEPLPTPKEMEIMKSQKSSSSSSSSSSSATNQPAPVQDTIIEEEVPQQEPLPAEEEAPKSEKSAPATDKGEVDPPPPVDEPPPSQAVEKPDDPEPEEEAQPAEKEASSSSSSSEEGEESDDQNKSTKKAIPFPTTLDGIIKSRETGGKCQDCGHAPADVRCDECALSLCRSCDDIIHSRNAFSSHRPVSLSPSPGSFPRSICNYCKTRPSIAMCLQCDSNSTMCSPCWFNTHKDRHKALHKPKLLLWPCDNCFIEQQLKGEGRAPPALWFCPSCSLRLCRLCWRNIHGADEGRQYHTPTDIYSKENSPLSLQPGRREATQMHYSQMAAPLMNSDLSVHRSTQKLHRLGFDPVVRYRLLNYITLMCPHKLPSVVPTLRLFAGRTEELFARLTSRYGPEPPYDCLRLPLPYGWRLVQSAYGDVFYLHSSGSKQWDRPGLHKASEAANLLVTVGHHGLLQSERSP